MDRGPYDTELVGKDTVRAVVRALRLLRTMNSRPIWSLRDLHRVTQMPKATLSRLLGTLAAEGYVRWEDAVGIYRLTSKVRELSEGCSADLELIDANRLPLLRITKRIKLPLAIGVFDGSAIEVRFSSMPHSRFAVRNTTLGNKHGIFTSAMGRVFLAFCSQMQRESLMTRLDEQSDGTIEDQKALIHEDINRVRTEGYALRRADLKRQSATLAVPILSNGELIAILSMTTFDRLMDKAMIEANVPIMRNIARDISSNLHGEVPGEA